MARLSALAAWRLALLVAAALLAALVKKGLEILTESQLLFVRACIKEGVDGFYTSTQGSEARRCSNPAIFSKYVKPFDLVSMKEIATACKFNILHVCDYVAPYANYV